MSNLTDALIAAKLVGGSGGSGGGSGLPSSIYYIMTLEPADDDSADITFRRPEDEYNTMFSTVRVTEDTETGGHYLAGFGELVANPEADPPIPEEDIVAMKLKFTSWLNTSDSYGGEAWYKLITGEVNAEFYVFPYIL